MPAPVGNKVRIISWGIPGIDGVSLSKVIVQKTTEQEANNGIFWDFATLNAVDADGNFVMGFQDNQSDDNFLYRVAFVDTNGRRSLPSEPGTAGVLSLRSALLDRLRLRLGDDDPSRLQLDNNTMYRWDRLKISAFLDESLLEFNSAKPTHTKFTLETSNDEVLNIVLTFAEAKCLRERARIELANRLTYSDGISITIDRSSDYESMADKTRDMAKQDALEWKSINRAKARGLSPQRLPFRVLRPLSFGPNSSNLFA